MLIMLTQVIQLSVQAFESNRPCYGRASVSKSKHLINDFAASAETTLLGESMLPSQPGFSKRVLNL